jgi:hypothetical protein
MHMSLNANANWYATGMTGTLVSEGELSAFTQVQPDHWGTPAGAAATLPRTPSGQGTATEAVPPFR